MLHSPCWVVVEATRVNVLLPAGLAKIVTRWLSVLPGAVVATVPLSLIARLKSTVRDWLSIETERVPATCTTSFSAARVPSWTAYVPANGKTCAYDAPGWIIPDLNEPSSATTCRATLSLFFQMTRSPFWIEITVGANPVAVMPAVWSSAPAGAAAARPRTSRGRMMSFRIRLCPPCVLVCTPMLSGGAPIKTTCKQALHGFYGLDLGDAQPAADHGFGRLAAAGVASHGWQEVVAVEREQVDFGRCAHRRCARDVA